jgi:hypothetical protein
LKPSCFTSLEALRLAQMPHLANAVALVKEALALSRTTSRRLQLLAEAALELLTSLGDPSERAVWANIIFDFTGVPVNIPSARRFLRRVEQLLRNAYDFFAGRPALLTDSVLVVSCPSANQGLCVAA